MKQKTKFKDTEIGVIPEDWEVIDFSTVSQFKYGKMPQKTDVTDMGYPIFSGYKIVGHHKNFMYEDSKLIIVARGVGGTGDVKLAPPKSYITNLSIIANLNEQVVSKYFLKYYFYKGLRYLDSGSAQSQITISDLNLLKIACPPLPEQKAIAKILSDLDSKIELLQRQNKTLEAIGQVIFKHWFVDFEFPNEEGNPYKSSGGEMVFNEELGKEIPKGWGVKNLGEFLNVIKGCSYKSEDLKESDKALITLKSINRDGGFNQKGYKEYVGDYKEEQIVKDGDIVVAQTDLTQAAEVIGTPAIVNSLNRYIELIASLDLQILRIKEKLNKGFAYFLLKTAMFHNHALSYTNGTTVLHLNKNAVPDFKFTLPNENILGKFGKIAEQILEKGDKNEKEVYILSQIRDSLLPKLMSGKIRVLNNQKIKEAV